MVVFLGEERQASHFLDYFVLDVSWERGIRKGFNVSRLLLQGCSRTKTNHEETSGHHPLRPYIRVLDRPVKRALPLYVGIYTFRYVWLTISSNSFLVMVMMHVEHAQGFVAHFSARPRRCRCYAVCTTSARRTGIQVAARARQLPAFPTESGGSLTSEYLDARVLPSKFNNYARRCFYGRNGRERLTS